MHMHGDQKAENQQLQMRIFWLLEDLFKYRFKMLIMFS